RRRPLLDVVGCAVGRPRHADGAGAARARRRALPGRVVRLAPGHPRARRPRRGPRLGAGRGMTPSTSLGSARTQTADHGLTLVRAHPRRDRLHLDLTDEDGGRVIGQWLVDPGTAETVATATAAVAPGRVRLLGAHLVLQSGGADRRLRALAPLVADGAEVVVPRPHPRAVVRT